MHEFEESIGGVERWICGGASTERLAREARLPLTGRTAQFYAGCVEHVEGVDFLAFGLPQAMWHLR
ncbi:MAG TPA: hypothetical protein VKA01_13335, partial [Vicinamibacteria bacterium]|nr:hypothetical protein [Vicinamibacteria bacterium]